MSNEKLADWLSDNEMDLVDQYTQTDKGYKNLIEFLFSKGGEESLDKLFMAFLCDYKARADFNQWASELYQNRGPEPEACDGGGE